MLGRFTHACRRPVVRAATFAISIVAVGLFLVMASALDFTPTWIGLGLLAISVVGASAMVVADRPEAEPVRHG
jgi:peptidoglycan/LPS O-acetylase OafA/YrhL